MSAPYLPTTLSCYCHLSSELEEEFMSHPLTYKGPIRVRMGVECIKAADAVIENASALTCPLLVFHSRQVSSNTINLMVMHQLYTLLVACMPLDRIQCANQQDLTNCAQLRGARTSRSVMISMTCGTPCSSNLEVSE
jgi:hypothetical protein